MRLGNPQTSGGVTSPRRFQRFPSKGSSDELIPNNRRALPPRILASSLAGQTLQPTALVHEAWLRLVGNQNQQWDGRAHFFGAAAEAMRRILIDRARRKRAVRHGGDQQRVEIQEVDLAVATDDDQLLAVSSRQACNPAQSRSGTGQASLLCRHDL